MTILITKKKITFNIDKNIKERENHGTNKTIRIKKNRNNCNNK